MSQAPPDSSFNLLYLFRIIRKYLLYIGGVVAGAALLAFILTLPAIYAPEFKASTIIYPTSAERYDVINLFHDEPILYLYGESKEVEKLEHLANSEEVKFFVIDSLNLWEVYGVNPTDESPKYYVLRTYDGMVSTVRVAGNGLMIEAYDIDPQRAADIVNLIVGRVDQLNKEMLNQNKSSIYRMYREGYRHLTDQLALYTDSVRRVRKRYNVFNPETQTRALVEQVMSAEGELAAARGRYGILKNAYGANSSQAKNAENEMRILQTKVNSMVKAGGGNRLNLESFRDGLDQVLALEEICEYLARDVKDAREKVEVLEMMDQDDYTTILITEYAKPADKKSRPVRWVILVATVLIAALTATFGAVLIDRITETLDQASAEQQ